MDKFGIFNLLNSFLNFSNNDTQNKTAQTDNNSDKNSPSFKDLLSVLSPSLNNENKEQHPIKKDGKKLSSPPLQLGMLNTLKSHDDFIKRVKQNNKV